MPITSPKLLPLSVCVAFAVLFPCAVQLPCAASAQAPVSTPVATVTPAPGAPATMDCHTPDPQPASSAVAALPAPPQQAAPPQQQQQTTSPQSTPAAPPDAPSSTRPLQTRAPQSPAEAAEALRVSKLARINGVPYDQPSVHDTVVAYAKDTYGLNGIVATSIRALYSEARGKPSGWGTDAAGFGQRFGASAAVTAINGNVRLGMELLFHEDLRYLSCNGCSAVRKVENALLSEITARHDEDGHRFFTLTPTIADFSGPIIVHAAFYPGASRGPSGGAVAARTVFATRIGLHVVQEFFADPSKQAKKADKKADKAAAKAAAKAGSSPS